VVIDTSDKMVMFKITEAKRNERLVALDFLPHLSTGITMIGDKGYVGNYLEDAYAAVNQIFLPLRRRNAKHKDNLPEIQKERSRIRRRIETWFSRLKRSMPTFIGRKTREGLIFKIEQYVAGLNIIKTDFGRIKAS
jgi:hypothetical protein